MMQNQLDNDLLSDLGTQVSTLLTRHGMAKESALIFRPEEESLHVHLTPGEQPAIKLNTPRPARLGALMDALLRAAQTANLPDSLPIGPFILRRSENMLSGENGDTIRLTDKECDILCALTLAGTDGLEKDDLLERVWAYASGVETHTLETHIYRLRQKIEADPAAPTLLVNEDGYYRLNY